jgi:cbb3-type cytochrome c oxidase subunit III
MTLRFFLPFLLPALAMLQAQDHGSITTNPFSTPEDRIAGMQLFRSTCAACHGLEGGGGSNGPSLTTGTFKHGGSDGALFQTITKGVPDTPMAPHPLDGRAVWQLIAFIRSLNIGRGAEQAKGDPAKGAQVFAASGCARCHTAGGSGGFLGPDLSGIGLRRSLPQLEASLLEPNAEVSPDYWSLRAKTRSE